MIRNIILILCFMMLCQTQAYTQEVSEHSPKDPVQVMTPVNAQKLIDAYPDQQLSYTDNQIVFKDGSRIIFDDGKTKDFNELLDHSDIEDIFLMEYSSKGEPAYLQDAGRSRCESFFKKMYGNSAKAVKANLVTISWFGQKVKFSKINGASEQLSKVAQDIRLEHPEFIPYMKSSGTFKWRKVHGSDRMSAHSYGIAIDIAVDRSDYWQWGNPRASETDKILYKNRIPTEIVEIFERHGFIWGGRWYHYDTMHFEYRPEILSPQKQATGVDKSRGRDSHTAIPE